jgi:1,4-alpha-glucan branching enzyme
MITKDYTKTGRSCRVTFALPAGDDVQNVSVVGEFNGWDPSANPMKRRKDGSFKTTVSLRPGRDYRFRYYLGNGRWADEHAADAHIPNEHGSHDSVVSV